MLSKNQTKFIDLFVRLIYYYHSLSFFDIRKLPVNEKKKRLSEKKGEEQYHLRQSLNFLFQIFLKVFDMYMYMYKDP